MTTQLQSPQCPTCGGTLKREYDENYSCKKCGEEFNLKGLSKMELSLDEFDRLLLYTLKKGKPYKQRISRL